MSRPGHLMLVLLALLLALAPVAGAEPTLTDEPTLAVELGYGGTIAYLRTMPVAVTVSGGSRDIEATVTLDVYRDTKHYDRYEYPVSVAARSTQRFVVPLKLMMRQPEFQVRLESGGETLAEATVKPTRELGNNAVLVGVLSPDPASLFYMNMSAQSDMLMTSELWTTIPLDARSFPDNANQMNAFNLLVVDGFDPRTLSERQQSALTDWIAQGGIAIVGGGAGAPVSYPFFEEITGLSAGALVEATDVPRALTLHRMGLEASAGGTDNGEALSKLPAPALLVNQVTGEADPAVAGQYPLVFHTPYEGGAVVTAAFELGAKALGQWDQMHLLWLNHIGVSPALQSPYRAAIERFQEYGYGDSDRLASMATDLRVPSAKSATPALVLLCAYLLLVGVISYLLLKRLDKRELMWLTVPVLAVVFALSVRALGARLRFDLPLGVTLTQVSYSERGEAQVKSGGAVTTNSMQPVTISSDLASRIQPADDDYGYYDYDYDQRQEQKAPSILKYRHLLGDKAGIVIPNAEAWSVFPFQLDEPRIDAGRVTGRAWMEEDGLHAEIVNDSGQTLTKGVLLGNLGFNRMADLPAGQTGAALLKQPAGTDQGMLIEAQPASASQPMATPDPVIPGDDEGQPADDESMDDFEGDTPDGPEGDSGIDDGEQYGDEPDGDAADGPEGDSLDDQGEDTEEDPQDDAQEAFDPNAPAATLTPGPYGYTSSYGYGGSSLTALPVDGELRAVGSQSSYMDWDYLMAIAHPDATLDPQHGLSWDDNSPENRFMGDVYSQLNSDWNRWTGYSATKAVELHYVALAERMPAPSLVLDGQAVDQVLNRAFVDVDVAFEPIGPTGVVCYLPGMIPCQYAVGQLPDDPAQLDETNLQPCDSGNYYSANATVDFAFTLADGRAMDVEQLELSMYSDGAPPKMALYNFRTKAWDERVALYERLQGAQAADYLSAGKLFVRVVPDAQNVSLRGYSGGFNAPIMALKGRLK